MGHLQFIWCQAFRFLSKIYNGILWRVDSVAHICGEFTICFTSVAPVLRQTLS